MGDSYEPLQTPLGIRAWLYEEYTPKIKLKYTGKLE